MDEMSKFVASNLILGSLEKAHKLAHFSKTDQMLFFPVIKLDFVHLGLCVMWGGWVLQVKDSFKMGNTCESVTLNIKEKYPPF